MERLISTADEQALRSIIDSAHNVVVTCHMGPDGDAIGSVLATTLWLTRLGKNVTPIVPDAYPDFLKWLPGADRIRVCLYHEKKVRPIIDEADLIIYQDFNEDSRMDSLARLLAHNRKARRLMFDHHLNPLAHCDLLFSFPELSATCEVLFRILRDLGEYASMTTDEATCLYCGLMTDTGAFTYNSNRPEVFNIIGELIAKGIDKDRIYRNVFHSWSVDRFRLMGYLLYVNWHYIDELHASIITLDAEERKQFGYQKGDTEGLVNMPLQIRGTRLSIFLREDTEKAGRINVSLRSIDDIPCNIIAQECFNGGGHRNASGGHLLMSMPEALAYTRHALQKYTPLLKD